jgi:hypothetical protein
MDAFGHQRSAVVGHDTGMVLSYATSATSTAVTLATTAPTMGTNAPTNVRTITGATDDPPARRSASPIAIYSTTLCVAAPCR